MSDPSNMMQPSGVTDPSNSGERLEEAVELFGLISRCDESEMPEELRDLAAMLLQLAEISGELQQEGDSGSQSQQSMNEFLLEACEQIKAVVGTEASDALSEIKQRTLDRWGELLDPRQDSENAQAFEDWDAESPFEEATEAESETPAVPSADDITRLLAGLAERSPQPATDSSQPRADVETDEVMDRLPDSDPPLVGELREAFLDDAERCVASLEEALLTLESQPDAVSPLRQILRELHTLKGAAGSVGLNGLASFIHELEETLRECETTNTPPNIESLLAGVDTIRRRVDEVRTPGKAAALPQSAPATTRPIAAVAPSRTQPSAAPQPAVPPRSAADSAPAARPATRLEEAPAEEETVRVRTSQLNRLMDLLSELVMLRNRRGMELADLEEIHHQLVHAVSRLRILGDEGTASRLVPALPAKATAVENAEISPPLPRVNEITNDLFDSAQRLRSCFRPVAEGNAAVSQFIRQFRHELVELQRTPVSGLFRRLRRSVRDAARVERKQVELSWRGEETGMERSLQEKVYEPLLHIVRNCVSHGIESPEERVARGKPAAGQVVLRAHSGPDLLVIEVRDDGRGLDYDAIRRRGLERGMLKPDMAPSREELAQLIFQPGFSTRDVTTELAGRGVGMDVVAATLSRLRGWIQVDSEPDQGTTIRLNIPLPSVIQHTMVLRSAGQLFALPMQFVRGAGGDAGGNVGGAVPVRLTDLLGAAIGGHPLAAQRHDDGAGHSTAGPSGQRLVLDCGAASEGDATGVRRVSLWVDEIVGPEEVVVRPLPALLKQHPLCSGATLSGMGELVLVLDAHGVAALGSKHLHAQATASRVGNVNSTSFSATEQPLSQPAYEALSDRSEDTAAMPRPCVLVTDDSVTARTRLVQSLQRYDFEIVEASDGAEALELLRRQDFDAVFSDLEMPNLDGLGLLAEIKGCERTSGIPVVIVSSRTEDEYVGRASELGVDGYLGKPIEDAQLDRTLETMPALRAQRGKPNFHVSS